MDEGYIKFNINWEKGTSANSPQLDELISWRDRMHALNLIGYDSQFQVSFGNISLKPKEEEEFIISGTQTGHIPHLGPEHFTRVTSYDISANQLNCFGPVKASSESLTHAAIYKADANTRAVIHIHHDEYWAASLNKVPTTNRNVPYGTPEMAYEILRLFSQNRSGSFDVIAMAGHQGGMISFGKTLEEAANPFLKVFK